MEQQRQIRERTLQISETPFGAVVRLKVVASGSYELESSDQSRQAREETARWEEAAVARGRQLREVWRVAG